MVLEARLEQGVRLERREKEKGGKVSGEEGKRRNKTFRETEAKIIDT